MCGIRRNAEDLVKFHEKFVERLKSAVEPLGFGSAFIGSPAALSGANYNADSQRAIENVDVAVRLVAEAFAQQVCFVCHLAPCGIVKKASTGKLFPTLRGVLSRPWRGGGFGSTCTGPLPC